jgi:hypothetical protein
MTSNAKIVKEYLLELPEERKVAVDQLRAAILKNLPEGFEEGMGYGMIGYYVPHSLYPAGYHCDSSLPLPYMNIASQKNFIAVYSLLVYAKKEILDWFLKAYRERTGKKPDMGKSCIRFKNPDIIPFDLIGELASKMTVKEWIHLYESVFLKKEKA